MGEGLTVGAVEALRPGPALDDGSGVPHRTEDLPLAGAPDRVEQGLHPTIL